MASVSQLDSTSMLGQDRQRGASAPDVEGGCNHNALMNSAENRSPTKMVVLSYSPSDGIGNLSAAQVLSPEGLWLV